MNANLKRPWDLFREFIKSGQASGVILIVCTIVSLTIANSSLGHSYTSLWNYELGFESIGLKKNLSHWIDDGLMALFFLLVGLEIRREIVEGELSSIRKSFLPLAAALGGMIVPAIIYSVFNINEPTESGWGVPMATDIAFAIGIVFLLGKKVPFGLKVMLTALAIVDDLGAIMVIAIFYTHQLLYLYLLYALIVWILIYVLNKSGVKLVLPYVLLGLLLWYFILKSGIHATISGVLLALALPFGKGKDYSVAEKMEHFLQKPVSYIIMPIFALCNTGFEFHSSIIEALSSHASIGILMGLFVGKPLGIFSFSFLSIKAGLAQLPSSTSWKQLLGAGFLGGIGFTMSIFISLLAFEDPLMEINAKIAILVGSLLSGLFGYLILKRKSTFDKSNT